MASPTAVAAQYAGSNIPVLCVDTCSIIDIVRNPVARDEATVHAEQTMRLLNAFEATPQRLGVVVASRVQLELNANLQSNIGETRNALAELDKTIQRISTALSKLAGAPVAQSPLVGRNGFDQWASSVIGRFLRTAPQIDYDKTLEDRASLRAIMEEPPAKKGSIKDALIMETYLEFASEFRKAGGTSPIVLLSSNVRDYCSPPASGTLHPSLAPYFGGVGLLYANNPLMACSLLGPNI